MSDAARLFVAVRPPPDPVDHLDDALGPMRPRWPGVRWTVPVMWHLTCAFFGDVGIARIGDLEARLARVATRHRAVAIRFAGAGAFPRPARATVVYAGVGLLPPTPVAGSELAALAASCAAAGRRLGLAMQDRAYRPHLTLGRVKGREPLDLRPLVDGLRDYQGPGWSASAIVLVRSHLGAQPRSHPGALVRSHLEALPRYETLASWPLVGDRP